MLNRLCEHRLHPVQSSQRDNVEAKIHDLNERKKKLHDAARRGRKVVRIAEHVVAILAGDGTAAEVSAPIGGALLGLRESCRAIRHDFHRGDETVAASRDGLNESRIVSRIAESVAQFVDRCIEAVVVIDERVRGPELQPQFFARHHVAGTREQLQENLERLPHYARARLAVLAQLARAAIQLVQAEAKN